MGKIKVMPVIRFLKTETIFYGTGDNRMFYKLYAVYAT